MFSRYVPNKVPSNLSAERLSSPIVLSDEFTVYVCTCVPTVTPFGLPKFQPAVTTSTHPTATSINSLHPYQHQHQPPVTTSTHPTSTSINSLHPYQYQPAVTALRPLEAQPEMAAFAHPGSTGSFRTRDSEFFMA